MFLGGFVGLVIGIAVTVFALKGPLPFFDNGSHIYATPDERSRDAVVSVLSEFGLKPRRRIDSAKIKRALMSDNSTIINYSAPDVWDQMGRPAGGLALRVSDPSAAALKAVRLLTKLDFQAEVLGELDNDVPKGAMVFVKTDAFANTVLVFRRHFFRMGSPPPKWK